MIHYPLLFLIDTGARLGELYNLKQEDLISTQWGYIARVTGKTGERIVPVSYETYKAISVHIPFPYKKHWLGRKISLAFDTVGVYGTAHVLRHTFATLWEGSEFALQKIMGHSKIETLRLYRHLNDEMLSNQHNKYSPLLKVRSSALQGVMV